MPNLFNVECTAKVYNVTDRNDIVSYANLIILEIKMQYSSICTIQFETTKLKIHMCVVDIRYLGSADVSLSRHVSCIQGLTPYLYRGTTKHVKLGKTLSVFLVVCDYTAGQYALVEFIPDWILMVACINSLLLVVHIMV